MEKKFKLLPPMMPNFIHYGILPGKREDEFKSKSLLSITDLTEEEAIEYGQLMKDTFIEHWRKKSTKP